MKNIMYLLVFNFYLVGAFEAVASEAAASETIFGGGGTAGSLAHDQLSEFDQMNRWHRYISDRNELIQQGKLQLTLVGGSHALYDFPLTTNQSYPGFYGISNFVDLNFAFPNQLQDYTDGTRTYDLSSGYNHGGIDFFTWPYGWHKMDHDEVQVIAAEAGTITTKIDGNFDRICSFDDPMDTGWNAVYVTHADGSYAWYGHLKSGTLTSKPVGATVVVGEYLGVVGSSGNSTAPHLHFETHDIADNVIEPYYAAFNQTTSDSWWRDQKPYYDSKINQLITHTVPPALSDCPTTTDTLNDSQYFTANDRVYLAAYYSDQLEGQVTSYQVIRPDNTVADSWTHFSEAFHYSASYWYWIFDLPATPQSGQWTFKATYESQDVEHYFWVGDLIFDNGFE